jgi:hypothetical protein
MSERLTYLTKIIQLREKRREKIKGGGVKLAKEVRSNRSI